MRSSLPPCLWGKSTGRKSNLRDAAGDLRSLYPTCRKFAPSKSLPSQYRMWSGEARGKPIDQFPQSLRFAYWQSKSLDSSPTDDSLWGNLKRACDRFSIKFPARSWWKGRMVEKLKALRMILMLKVFRVYRFSWLESLKHEERKFIWLPDTLCFEQKSSFCWWTKEESLLRGFHL